MRICRQKEGTRNSKTHAVTSLPRLHGWRHLKTWGPRLGLLVSGLIKRMVIKPYCFWRTYISEIHRLRKGVWALCPVKQECMQSCCTHFYQIVDGQWPCEESACGHAVPSRRLTQVYSKMSERQKHSFTQAAVRKRPYLHLRHKETLNVRRLAAALSAGQIHLHTSHQTPQQRTPYRAERKSCQQTLESILLREGFFEVSNRAKL